MGILTTSHRLIIAAVFWSMLLGGTAYAAALRTLDDGVFQSYCKQYDFLNATVNNTGQNCTVDASGAAGAPADATYITQTANGTLSNEQAMGALATGLVQNTTTTGVQTIATAGTDYVIPAGNVATATALAANPTDCGGGEFANAIDAGGNLSCATPAAGAETNSLEVLTTGIATTEIPIGTAANTVVYAPLSGDVVMDNAGAVTVNTSAVADALASDPTDCSANQFAQSIVASGNLTCAAIADADVPNSITIDLAATATALAANPNDCSAGQFATTIAANGDLSCATVGLVTAAGVLTEAITQSSHPFSLGDWVYHNGTIYALADADAAATAESIGVVLSDDGANDFTLQIAGRITGLTGLTVGEAHFLSTTAGTISATAPVADGDIIKPVLIADSTTTGFVFNMRGTEIGAAGGGDVSSSSNIADNRAVRGDGGAKGVQESLMTILDSGFVGIGPAAFTPLENLHVAESASTSSIAFDVYSTTTSHATNLQFRKSASATIPTQSETGNADKLGTISFRGVNTSSDYVVGAQIAVTQRAAAGAGVPSEMSFQTSDSTGASVALLISPDGEVTKPLQPSFQVTNTGAQNNMSASGANVTIILDNEIFDIGGNFASNSFTAPITGKYQLNVQVDLTGIDTASSSTRIHLTTSNRAYIVTLDPRQFVADIAGKYPYAISVLADMDVGDTASVDFAQDGGSAQVDILAGDIFFSGFLVL